MFGKVQLICVIIDLKKKSKKIYLYTVLYIYIYDIINIRVYTHMMLQKIFFKFSKLKKNIFRQSNKIFRKTKKKKFD